MTIESRQIAELSLVALRERVAAYARQGLADTDPLTFYYLQALLENLSNRPHLAEAVTQSLCSKAAMLVSEFKQNSQADAPQSRMLESEQRHLERGLSKLKALNQELSQRIGRHGYQTEASQQDAKDSTPTHKMQNDAMPKSELQALKQYQQLFEKMSVERLLSKVMHEIPENAGPLNPERVVIRCLSALQEISPVYAMRLIGYYESLINLQSLPISEK